MTFEQLSIFVAVAERQHLTKAAEALRLTPSAVSAAIKVLEGFYNVQLFHRVGRGIELTEAGRVFLDEAKAVLSRAQSRRWFFPNSARCGAGGSPSMPARLSRPTGCRNV